MLCCKFNKSVCVCGNVCVKSSGQDDIQAEINKIGGSHMALKLRKLFTEQCSVHFRKLEKSLKETRMHRLYICTREKATRRNVTTLHRRQHIWLPRFIRLLDFVYFLLYICILFVGIIALRYVLLTYKSREEFAKCFLFNIRRFGVILLQEKEFGGQFSSHPRTFCLA